MDFDVTVMKRFEFGGGWNLLITSTTVSTWFAMAVLITLGVVTRIKLRGFKPVPETRFQKFIEFAVEMFENFNKSTLDRFSYLGRWFFGLIAFIGVMNLSGLLGFRAASADLATTAAFGISTFVILHFMWMKERKWRYLTDYIEPIPVFLPMNIVSELATPVSLSFRLFGNLLGGMIIMGLIYSLPFFVKVGIPAVLHVYFDLFAGCIQAFIFTVLSMTFIRNKLPE